MVKTKKVMLISADHPEEVRAVIIENGKLEEFIVEHSGQELLKGNVYLGVISRVEPGIEAAFVDIGWKKFGFLPFKDVLKENYVQTGEKKAKIRIQDVLIRGQKILVQVVKESRDHKGPSLTNGVTIPGRFLVLMNGSDSSGVSRKIEDEAERKKLKVILKDLNIPENMGIIVRTAGLGRTKIELQKDIQMLMKIWNDILNGKKNSDQAPCLLYQGPDMVVRTVRDHFTADTTEIMVDKKESYKALKDFIKLMMPRMIRRVKHYQESRPLFAKYNIEEQIQNIYRRTVDLPSGGSIVFDSGEAMVAIDVNSGKATGESDLEETALRTNLEAADAIGRELRLRDLGGLVVIDFIDMFQKKNKSLVEKQLKLSVKSDKARINMARLSRFGLMELSRQRIAPPVKDAVFDKCNICSGTGHVKSDNAASLDVMRKIQNIISDDSVKKIAVTVSNTVAQHILNNKKEFLVDIENKQNVKIDFYGRENISQENFIFSIVEKVTEEEKKISKISEIVQNPETEAATDTDTPKAEVKSDRPRGRTRKPSTGEGQRKRTSKSSTRNNTGRGRRRTPNRSRTPRNPENTTITSIPDNTSDNISDNIGNRIEKPDSENKALNQPTSKPQVIEKDPVVGKPKITDQNLEVSGNIKPVEVVMDSQDPSI
ncbi:MAG: Rne/Rng family ribonuclease [Nitrospinales bacterium]